jgi:hypothetical protein
MGGEERRCHGEGERAKRPRKGERGREKRGKGTGGVQQGIKKIRVGPI